MKSLAGLPGFDGLTNSYTLNGVKMKNAMKKFLLTVIMIISLITISCNDNPNSDENRERAIKAVQNYVPRGKGCISIYEVMNKFYQLEIKLNIITVEKWDAVHIGDNVYRVWLPFTRNSIPVDYIYVVDMKTKRVEGVSDGAKTFIEIASHDWSK